MRLRIIFLGFTLLINILISSCSSAPNFIYKEPCHDTIENGYQINNQAYITAFLERMINSDEYYSIEVLSRRTFSPLIKQTKLLTHSFYLINSYDGRYYTLSFTGTNFLSSSFGYWVLNKDTDISSYRLYLEDNNIWNVDYLYSGYSIDTNKTLRNIINAINVGSKYYYRDHIKNRENHFNCNSAVSETIVINSNNNYNIYLTSY